MTTLEVAGHDTRPDTQSSPGDLRRPAAWVAVTSILLLCVAALLYPDVSGNPASRLATVEALVDHGTWAIDDSQFFPETIDAVQIDGRSYSSKPPILPLIGAGAYAAVQLVTGWTLHDDLPAVHTALRVLLQIVPFAVFLFYFWRFLGLWMNHPRGRLWLFVATALASYLFGYSSALNNHAPAAFCVMGAWMCGYRAARAGGGTWSWLLAGFWAGFAVVLDLGAGPVVAALGIYLIRFSPLRAVLLFGAAALLPLGVNAWLNWEITGSVVPIYLQRDLYHFEGSYWLDPQSYDSLRESKWLYLFHITFGHHGWFSMNPLMLLAIPGVVALWRRGRRAESLALATGATLDFVYYWWQTANYGGGCMGMRWLIVTTPLWLLALGAWMDEAMENVRRRRWLLVLGVISLLHTLPMVWDPWTRSPWHRLFQWLGMGSV